MGAGYLLTWLAVGMLRAAWGMWRTRRDADPEEGAPSAAARLRSAPSVAPSS